MTTNAHEPMPGMNEYRDSIDKLQFSEEAKARMTARLAEAAHSTPAAPKATVTQRKRKLPLAAAAACVALALGLGGIAYATGGLVSMQQFVSHLFGRGEAQVEVVNKIGRPVGVTQSVNGVTVSADAIIGDKHNVSVIFSVAKDDGTAFEGIEALEDGLLPLGFSEELDVSIPLVSKIAQGLGATGSSYFYDEDPSDNAIQLVETRSYEGGGSDFSLIGHTMTAHFSDLMLFGEGEPTVIAKGDWKLSFPLNYEDASVSLPTGQSFELAGFTEDDAAEIKEPAGPIDATIDELSVSPIALHVKYTANHKVTWTSGESGRQSTHDSRLTDVLLTLSGHITMRDGTVIEVANYGGGSISEDADVAHCESSIFFDRIIDLDKVASITIGGTTIEL